MAIYEYRCRIGHVEQLVQSMAARHPKTVKCKVCQRRAARIFSTPAVVDDFPEHFNVSLGCVVKNRAHHKQLQRDRNLQDWEPCKDSPGSQLSLGRR